MPESERTHALARYQSRTSIVTLVLALVFVAAYGVPIAWPELPGWALTVCRGTNVVVWALFAIDLVVRALLHGRPLRYLLRHPIDVVLTVLPMFRPLRVLRVFTVAQVLFSRRGRFSIGKSTQAIAVAASLLVLVGALAVLDAERDAPDATIRNMGDALWWAMTTVTTVGYGDTYPVTALGRVVAALMLVGISLVGAVTATIGAWFLEQARSPEEEAEQRGNTDRRAGDDQRAERDGDTDDGEPNGNGHDGNGRDGEDRNGDRDQPARAGRAVDDARTSVGS